MCLSVMFALGRIHTVLPLFWGGTQQYAKLCVEASSELEENIHNSRFFQPL